MTRAIAAILLVFLLASGLVFVLSDNLREGFTVPPAHETPAPAPAARFSASGVIDYYPNNVGAMIPYLVYQAPSGATAAKALIYCGVPAGRYSGSVHVEGFVEEESVCVDSITPA